LKHVHTKLGKLFIFLHQHKLDFDIVVWMVDKSDSRPGKSRFYYYY